MDEVAGAAGLPPEDALIRWLAGAVDAAVVRVDRHGRVVWLSPAAAAALGGAGAALAGREWRELEAAAGPGTLARPDPAGTLVLLRDGAEEPERAGPIGRGARLRRLSAAAAAAESARAAAEGARAEAEAEAEWSDYLAEAGRTLAGSIGSQETLQAVARLAVPRLADYCVVDVVTEGGHVETVALSARDPEQEEAARRFRRRFPVDPEQRTGVAQVIRSGASMLAPRVERRELEALAESPAQLAALAAAGIRSAMVVPLVARQRTLGAITFLTTTSARVYGEADLAQARELAVRAALALDNARLYEAALLANQSKRDFLSIMSHELRTPLTAVMGYTDLLLEEVSGPLTAQQRVQLERVLASSRHLLGLIAEILSFAGLESGGDGAVAAEVRLPGLVQELGVLVEPAARERGLSFRVEWAPEVPAVLRTDPTKARQVLLNLLLNAVKFTPRGEVLLRIAADPASILFEVTDTGIGIEPAHLERIFDPFWQVEDATTREAGGAGIGLAVARRIARLLRGDITVASEPGRGSVFTLRLPR
jgi:signal transduction histidine kinase